MSRSIKVIKKKTWNTCWSGTQESNFPLFPVLQFQLPRLTPSLPYRTTCWGLSNLSDPIPWKFHILKGPSLPLSSHPLVSASNTLRHSFLGNQLAKQTESQVGDLHSPSYSTFPIFQSHPQSHIRPPTGACLPFLPLFPIASTDLPGRVNFSPSCEIPLSPIQEKSHFFKSAPST